MDSFRQESFVDAGLLGVLSLSLDQQMKCDTLYSLLAAQVMASNNVPDVGDFPQWHSRFVEALERCGWTLRREQDLNPVFDQPSTVTLQNVFAQALTGEGLREPCELALEALDAFARLSTDSPSAVRFRERSFSRRIVKVGNGKEAQRFTVHWLLAVSARQACIDLFHLEFETTQYVDGQFLQQAFVPSSFTSPVLVKHHAFEMAARAFARSRAQIVAFVQGHQMMPIKPGIGLTPASLACDAVMAPDNLSPR
jgi:hypothetical protein